MVVFAIDSFVTPSNLPSFSPRTGLASLDIVGSFRYFGYLEGSSSAILIPFVSLPSCDAPVFILRGIAALRLSAALNGSVNPAVFSRISSGIPGTVPIIIGYCPSSPSAKKPNTMVPSVGG